MYKGVNKSKRGNGVKGGTLKVRITAANDKNAEMGVNYNKASTTCLFIKYGLASFFDYISMLPNNNNPYK